MEERFDKMICPNCGKEMRRGITPKSRRDLLIWYPGRNAPRMRELTHLPDSDACEDPSGGVKIGDTWDLFVRTYYPSWYCHECGMLLLDTKTLLAKQ